MPAGDDARFAVPPTVPEDTDEPEEAVGEEAAPGTLALACTALESNPSQEVGIGTLPPSPLMEPAPGMTLNDGTPA